MSFNNIGAKSGEARSAQTTRDTKPTVESSVREIADMLSKYQNSCNSIRQKIDSGKKGAAISLQAKSDMDSQLKSVKDLSSKVQYKIDEHIKLVNTLPREKAASQKVTIVKLQKDHDRMKNLYQTLVRDHSNLRVDRVAGHSQGSNQNPFDSVAQQHQEQLMMQPQDVDEALIEEREQDIQKINNDLVLVNEMFQDMAHLVNKQGEMVEKVADDTEQSRERAEAGLAQVQQAAKYQPTCAIM